MQYSERKHQQDALAYLVYYYTSPYRTTTNVFCTYWFLPFLEEGWTSTAFKPAFHHDGYSIGFLSICPEKKGIKVITKDRAQKSLFIIPKNCAESVFVAHKLCVEMRMVMLFFFSCSNFQVRSRPVGSIPLVGSSKINTAGSPMTAIPTLKGKKGTGQFVTLLLIIQILFYCKETKYKKTTSVL